MIPELNRMELSRQGKKAWQDYIAMLSEAFHFTSNETLAYLQALDPGTLFQAGFNGCLKALDREVVISEKCAICKVLEKSDLYNYCQECGRKLKGD